MTLNERDPLGIDEGSLEEGVSTRNIASVLKWMNEGAESTLIYPDEDVLFLDELTKVVRKRNPEIGKTEVAERGSRLLKKVDELADSPNDSAYRVAAKAASIGLVETARQSLPPGGNPINYSVLATAYFSKSIELGVFSDEGLSVGKTTRASDGMTLIAKGRLSGRYVTRGDIITGQDCFHAGLVTFAKAIAPGEISKAAALPKSAS